MKKLLLQFAILFSYTFAVAQNYIPIPDTLAVWSQQKWQGVETWRVTKEQVFTAEKMVADSFVYTVLRRTGYSEEDGYYTNKWHGLFRNDTITKRVFFRDSIHHPDQILYDFNLAIGDTILAYNGRTIINIIDSILADEMFGQVHRKFVFSEHSNWIPGSHGALIEGVGSLSGFGWDLAVTSEPAYAALECFSYKDSAYFFSNHSFFDPPTYSTASCERYTNAQNIDANEPIKVFPNPVAKALAIYYAEANSKSKAEIRILDVVGSTVLLEPLMQSNSTINCAMLQPGIYFWQVVDKGKTMGQGKVFKE